MFFDSYNSISRTMVPARAVRIYRIIGFVRVWNTEHKATRVLNTLYALEPGATLPTKAECA